MRKRAYVFLAMTAVMAVLLPALGWLIWRLGFGGEVILAVVVIAYLPVLAFILKPHFRPLWVNKVIQSGIEAEAVLLLGYDEYMQGTSYQGEDIWLSLPVRVESKGSSPYETDMKCRLSQASLLKKEAIVPVKVDPNNMKRVVMVGNVLDNYIGNL